MHYALFPWRHVVFWNALLWRNSVEALVNVFIDLGCNLRVRFFGTLINKVKTVLEIPKSAILLKVHQTTWSFGFLGTAFQVRTDRIPKAVSFGVLLKLLLDRKANSWLSLLVAFVLDKDLA